MFLRYIYLRASSLDNTSGSDRYQRILKIPHFHFHLRSIGIILLSCHTIYALMLNRDELLFDQACLRPHEDLHPQSFRTKLLNLGVLFYNGISIGFCSILFQCVRKEEAILESKGNLPKRSNKVPNMHLYFLNQKTEGFFAGKT